MSTEQSFTSDTGKRAHASNELFTIDFSPYMGRMNAPVLVPQEIVEKVRSAVKTHLSADGELLNLYVWGSRFYMNHSTRSDYDLVAIVTGYVQPKISNVITVDEHIDVALCEKGYFEALLEDHVPWAVAFAYYPPFGIVFENWKPVHRLLKRQQKRALTINSQVNLNQAAALWRHKEEYKARKRVFFVLQMTIFATQIVVSGRIYDFWDEANALRPYLFDPALDTWEKFCSVWKPLYQHLVDRFVDLRNSYIFDEIELLEALRDHRPPNLNKVSEQLRAIHRRPLPHVSPLSTRDTSVPSTIESDGKDPSVTNLTPLASISREALIAKVASLVPNYHSIGLPLVSQYINIYGLNALEENLAIAISRHPKYPNLIHLSRTPTLTPVDSVIACECNGLILDEYNDYKPVAFSHPSYFAPEDEPLPFCNLDLWSSASHISAFENPDGVLVGMYYYANQWMLATKSTPDASEKVLQGTPISELFWQTWQQHTTHIDMDKLLDKAQCYSFWLCHPSARNRLIQKSPALLIESALQWNSGGCIETPIGTLCDQLPFQTLIDRNKDSAETSSILQLLTSIPGNSSDKDVPSSSTPNIASQSHRILPDLPIGGLILQCTDRFSRIYIPSPYMQRLDRIQSLDGDYLEQELEMLRLLVEYPPDVESAWDYPLSASNNTFLIVSNALKGLIQLIEQYRPKIAKMTKAEILEESKHLGDVSHFIFLLHTTKPPFSSATEFLKHANPRRMKKYLVQWWTKVHSKAPPRTNLQYSYK